MSRVEAIVLTGGRGNVRGCVRCGVPFTIQELGAGLVEETAVGAAHAWCVTEAIAPFIEAAQEVAP